MCSGFVYVPAMWLFYSFPSVMFSFVPLRVFFHIFFLFNFTCVCIWWLNISKTHVYLHLQCEDSVLKITSSKHPWICSKTSFVLLNKKQTQLKINNTLNVSNFLCVYNLSGMRENKDLFLVWTIFNNVISTIAIHLGEQIGLNKVNIFHVCECQMKKISFVCQHCLPSNISASPNRFTM